MLSDRYTEKTTFAEGISKCGTTHQREAFRHCGSLGQNEPLLARRAMMAEMAQPRLVRMVTARKAEPQDNHG